VKPAAFKEAVTHHALAKQKKDDCQDDYKQQLSNSERGWLRVGATSLSSAYSVLAYFERSSSPPARRAAFSRVFESRQVPLFQRASYYLVSGPCRWPTGIPLGHPFERLHCGASSADCWEETKGSIPELACPTETQTVQKPELCPRQGQSGFSQISTNSSGTIRESIT
jgi:hypothetical protein